MSKTFHLTIAKVGENLFDGEAVSVRLPGSAGVFQVLAEHEPIVSELLPGVITVKAPDETESTFEITSRGLAEVRENTATVLL